MLDKNKNRGVLQPYLRNVNVRWFTFDLSDLKEMRFEENETERFDLRYGDLLICEGGEPGRAAVWKGQAEKAKFQKALHRVRFRDDEYDPTFAMYFIYYGTTTNSFAEYYTGTTIKHLTGKALSQVQFPVPPLPEQRRIVSKIEELFSDLDAGVSALERAKANLKRYRASVLKAAVEGRLTNLRRVPLVPLSELIEGLGQGWSPKCELNRDPDPDEWAIIKTTAVQSMAYSDQEAKPLPSEFSPRPDIEIRQGDILMTRKGPRSRCGVACLVRSTRHRLMVCDTVYRFRCRESQVLPEYLELALNSPTVIEEINKRKSGISESGLSLTHKKIGEVLIPTPALEEQAEISNDVARLLSLLESMLRTITSSDTHANRLKQSILKLAFEGGLVTPLADQTVHSNSTSASNVREEK
ncbi:MAG: restriction endonuclease subunit S [Planctomycetaceae bacterium]|nr:restriction endonuclease subunit S [Planctomycetaceae bacterium]